MQLQTERLTACPVCQSAMLFPEREHVTDKNSSFYTACASCGLLFLNPRMTDAQTEAYYRGDYRDQLGFEGGINEEDLRRQALRAAVQVLAFGALLGDCRNNLEIGCSAGFLMAELDRAGISSAGIEPDERYHQIAPANHFPVFSSLEELHDTRFDLICMSHVLEHINHPLEYMAALLEAHAHERTRVLIEVPNAHATEAAFLWHHPIAFTPHTLFGLFDRLGYKPLRVVCHDLSEDAKPVYLLALFGRK